MENQHRKITGYRELSQAEIDLMNEIKAMGAQLGLLCDKVQSCALPGDDEAQTFADSGKHDLKVGIMKLTRAIAKPTSF